MPVKESAHITFGRIRKVMSRLKISAISYLNTAPLMWDFEHSGAGADFDISYTIPSACAEALRAGTADIGIIPAAAYTTVPDLVIIPDVAIAARRAVRSILLVSKMPVDARWTQVRSVALDTSSMTSVALTKILFAKWLGGARDYKPMAPDLDAMLDKKRPGALMLPCSSETRRCRSTARATSPSTWPRSGRPARASHSSSPSGPSESKRLPDAMGRRSRMSSRSLVIMAYRQRISKRSRGSGRRASALPSRLSAST